MRLIFSLVLVISQYYVNGGILYPRITETRELISLDGLWHFSLNVNGSFNEKSGLSGNANDKDIHLMPVPSSYNDIPTTLDARDHLGPVRYERSFRIPNGWQAEKRIWLRFGSVCYSAKVYINDKLALTHAIGHLPFTGEITSLLNDAENVIKVIVDTTLTSTTVPQGYIETLPGGEKKLKYTFDFFNYGGIDRPVVLYTTPQTYIDDIRLTTSVYEDKGLVSYTTTIKGDPAGLSYRIKILDANNEIVAETDTDNGVLEVDDAHFWWPYLMHDDPGYLYTFKVQLYDSNNELVDSYSQPFGIRELAWNSTSFTINGKPVYLRGFGRHEDSDIRGKGLDLPLIIRDHNLMRWIGANAYRTSHYPYAEEIMDMADRLGIMIVDEVPAVNTENFNSDLLENHKRSLTELFSRDKNRPSVVMWSIANEPRTQLPESEDYYRHISAHIKSFDQTRPITIANIYGFDVDHSGQFLDILGVNKYSAWYEYAGDLETIVSGMTSQAEGWHKKHNKPVFVTEYGADAMEGLHILPDYLWSEEYQVKLMSEFFKAFDQLRDQGWFIGEMIWNFADFKTANDIRRVGGNKKGMFTRQRQPKNSAHFLRKRYWLLANKLDNITAPTDLENYVIE
ncbi:beta-glucuronidase [Diabrotica virgifera virgifera]|uniref:Beta-glucuronidase n=1 Tax=Diabrotica virgifera virgifera TaxID=50390 RepID=A0A6P7GML3_DIAVI|nr:beta-glucuronidase [Diabrotica virgifera virgifera]